MARLRHIQSLHEGGDYRNPDILVGELLPPDERGHCARLNERDLLAMRKDPFYYYLVARTKFYDDLLLEAVAAGSRRVLILGSGSDTRFYRFGGHLATHRVEVAECDQPDAMAIKVQLARSLPHGERVQYLPADLNSPGSWPVLCDWLNRDGPRPTLVFAEGVSPYVVGSAFERLLKELGAHLPGGSWLAYDFKGQDATDGAGTNQGPPSVFRLPFDEPWVSARHASLGFQRAALIETLAMMRTYLPTWNESVSAPYLEDGLVRLWR